MKSTQQQVIDYLRVNPHSTSSEVMDGLGKAKGAVGSALKAIRAKGFCTATVIDAHVFRYELTKNCEKNGFSSILPDQSIIVSSADGAAGRRPFPAAPYIPGAWESVRPGADDHKRHRSHSGEWA